MEERTRADEAAIGRHRLGRLEVLMDSVFAIVIVVIAGSFPIPSDVGWIGDSLPDFLLGHLNEISFAVIGMVMVVVYWIQNNLLFENLTHTDTKHVSIALTQIFALLFYFYAITLGIAFEDEPSALALQSIAAALVGFGAVAGWEYACRNRRLLTKDVSDETIRNIRAGILAEPISALITLPFALLGSDVWGAAWLVYPVISYWRNRTKSDE
jgi:uncharacterized membrane protein